MTLKPTKRIWNQLMLYVYGFCLVCLGESHILQAQGNFWIGKNGPFGSVNVTSIATSPNGFLYAAVDSVGIYKSTNGGKSWQVTNIAPAFKHAGSILINSRGDIFATCQHIGSNSGVFRSTDGGVSWVRVFSVPDYGSLWLAINSKNHLFLLSPSADSLYRSTNDGDSWISVWHPTTLVYAINHVLVSKSDNIYIAVDSMVLKSTDEGINWSQSSKGFNGIYIATLAESPNGYLLAISNLGDVYRSIDGGETWVIVSSAPAPYNYLSNFVTDPMGKYLFASVQPYNNVFRTSDDGSTWLLVHQGSSNTYENHGLAFDSSGYLFTEDTSGIVASNDLGMTWVLRSGFHALGISTLLVRKDGLIIANSMSGKFRSTDGGDTWANIPTLAGGIITQFLQHPNGDLFASGTVLYRSTDSGASWEPRYITNEVVSEPLYLTFDSNGVLFAAGLYTPNFFQSWPRIWRSTDEGNSWTILYGSLNQGSCGPLCSTSNGWLIATTPDSPRIRRSSDQGMTWLDDAMGFSTDIKQMISTNDGYVFATTGAHGVYRSTDDGLNWNAVNSGLAELAIRSISINNHGDIFIGTSSSGVFQSIDHGNNWFSLSSGLEDRQVLSLSVNEDGYLFAGTQWAGIFQSSLSTTSVEQNKLLIPMGYFLSQNFPNPFNPSTFIRYQIPNQSYVSLKIYNVLGQEIATLVDGIKNAGFFSVKFDAENLSSGIYFLQLKAGTFRQVKKMVLMK